MWTLCLYWIHMNWLSHTKHRHLSIYWPVPCALVWDDFNPGLCRCVSVSCRDAAYFRHISSSSSPPSILSDNATLKPHLIAVMITMMHHAVATIAYLLFKRSSLFLGRKIQSCLFLPCGSISKCTSLSSPVVNWSDMWVYLIHVPVTVELIREPALDIYIQSSACAGEGPSFTCRLSSLRLLAGTTDNRRFVLRKTDKGPAGLQQGCFIFSM